MTYFLANVLRADTRAKFNADRVAFQALVQSGKCVGASPVRNPFSSTEALRAYEAELLARDAAIRAERAKFEEPVTHPAARLAKHITPIVRTACTECGLAFEVARRGSTPPTVCGKDCRTQRKRRWLREWREREAAKITLLACVVCGGKVEWRRSSGQRRKTCSDECRGKHLYRSKVARRGTNPRPIASVVAGAFVTELGVWASRQVGEFTADDVTGAFPHRPPLAVLRALAHIITQRRGVKRVRRGVYRRAA